ncbi:RNA polymerase sigma factor [Aeromicrobium sp. CTD01-1L150]|uniref:RNA polymerase sigma factor n=1 Tax=Aeromicrobium sp. CTD01-1L150 TaxID=3341830 RepID=UPI0035BF6AFD
MDGTAHEIVSGSGEHAADSTREGAEPDAVLHERAAAGDRGAFSELYDRHVRPVYWQAYRVLRDGDLAEEVTQETFLVAWRRVRTIRVVDDSVLPWLLVTARQTAMNAHRRSRRPDHRTVELDDQTVARQSVEDEVSDALVRQEIEKAVSTLSVTDQQLYALCLDGDHTYAQAASSLGVSHASVRNRVHRLRTRLRADLRSMREMS